jgi:toxin FitB
MRYLLDTNVISELIARQPKQQVLDWLDTLDPHTIYLSVITVGEIQRGIEKLPASSRKQQLEDWLHNQLLVRFAGQTLEIDVNVMLTWGSLVAQLDRMGRPLPALDSLIAALARYHRCTLVTRNEKDFQDIDIFLLNPWTDIAS